MTQTSRALHVLRAVSGGVERVLLILLGAFMGGLLVAGTAQVVARYLLEISIVWPEETARYLMVTGTFLAVPVLTLRRRHIAVDALMYYLRSAVARRMLHRLLVVIECVFLGVVTWLAWTPLVDARESGQVSAGMQVPVWWPMAVVFVGLLLGFVLSLVRVAIAFLDRTDTWQPPEGIESMVADEAVPHSSRKGATA